MRDVIKQVIYEKTTAISFSFHTMRASRTVFPALFLLTWVRVAHTKDQLVVEPTRFSVGDEALIESCYPSAAEAQVPSGVRSKKPVGLCKS